MTTIVKNIIFFLVFAGLLFLVYYFFTKQEQKDQNLSLNSSSLDGDLADSSKSDDLTKDFLSLLLGIEDITLDSKIFSDQAFTALNDSSVELQPDNNKGKLNPFAQVNSSIFDNLSSEQDLTNKPVETNIDEKENIKR